MSIQNQEFELKLKLAEINMILEILGQRPYAEIFGLIQKIQSQAHGQMPAPHLAQVQG
jgi:hypothetical protein